jgi:predicted nucleotidyltransferase/HEPN domain-containing protein
VKTSLDHLPEYKQEELKYISATIVEIVKPEMVILFGSHSRGDWVEDSYRENGTLHEYKSDYDILVITQKPRNMPVFLEKLAGKKIRKALYPTSLQIITHDIDFLNKELEDGHYFFAEIVRDGTMLYDSGNFKFAEPKKLSGYQRSVKAKLYYDTWFRKADEFIHQYRYAVSTGSLDIAIFLLHQATERFYMAIELVFTDYKPRTHDLVKLNKSAIASDARFKMVFPNQTEEEKRLFDVLVKAYIDSRYKIDYKVVMEELQWLESRVIKLKELTEVLCLEHIEKLKTWTN